jgi:alanine racemase
VPLKLPVKHCKTERNIWELPESMRPFRCGRPALKFPILIFGYTPPDLAPLLIDYELTQTVYSLSTASALSEQATRKGKKIIIHLKVDSGMGRLGFLLAATNDTRDDIATRNSVRAIETISRLPGLTVEGIFTHFATADSADKSYATMQLDRFMDLLTRLQKQGLEPPVRHAANSGALIDMPDSHLDMVRPGIATYGLHPSDEVNKSRVDLRPVMSLKTRIIHLKRVPPGFNISYGITFQTKNHTTIATVPVGYADGFNRLLSSRGSHAGAWPKGSHRGAGMYGPDHAGCGRISGVALEDEVVVFGEQGQYYRQG